MVFSLSLKVVWWSCQTAAFAMLEVQLFADRGRDAGEQFVYQFFLSS